MKSILSKYLTILLVGIVSRAYAQEMRLPAVSPPLKWYAAVQLADHTFEFVVPGQAPGLTGVQPYELTVGRRLAPRWAVQASYSAYHFLGESGGRGTTETGEPMSSYTRGEDWVKAIPLLLRYRLTRNPAHRMQFDGLLGTALVSYRDTYESKYTINDQVVRQTSWSTQAMNAYLVLGSGASYRLGRHLEACFDLSLTRNLHTISPSVSRQQLNSTFGFQRGWSLGLRYRFNTSKGKQAE